MINFYVYLCSNVFNRGSIKVIDHRTCLTVVTMFRKCSGYGITWRVILTFVFPVTLLPLPILWPGSVSRCLYVLSLMGSYWSVSQFVITFTSLTPPSGC